MTLRGLKDRLGQLTGGRWLPLKWGFAVAALVLGLHALGAFDSVEPIFTDMHFAWRGKRPPSGEVVVVGISRQCTGRDRLGTWPWKRRIHGRLIDWLAKAGARSVCFDMYFPNPSDDPQDDELMAEAARRAGNVTLAVYKPDKISEDALEQGPFIPIERLVQNIDVLTQATTQSHINVRKDRDGIIRRVPACFIRDKTRYYQLGVLAAARYLGVSQGEIRIERSGLRVGDRLVPVDAAGDVRVNYYSVPEQLRLYLVSDILEGRVPANALRGKVVFVGQTIQGLQNADMVATPEGERFGVYVQATVADNIISGRMLRRASPLTLAFVVFVLSLACAWRLFVRRVLGKVAWSVVFAAVAVLFSHTLFEHLHMLLDLTPCLAVVVVGNLYGALVVGILKADKEVERRDLEMETVLETAKLSAEGEAVEIPDWIVASIGRALGAEGCSLYLRGDGGELALAASHGFAGGLTAADATAASQEANRQVADDRRPFFAHVRPGERHPTLSDERIRSALIIPLAFHDQFYGTLALYNKTRSEISPRREFTEHDFRLISLLTQQTTMTLDRSRLADSLAEALRDLEAAQEQLIESERLSAVGRMANMIIHDIKNPMQGIRMFAEMAAEADVSPEDRREFSETMCHEIDRLVGMCQEILDFARGTTNLSKADVPLDDYLMGAVLTLAAELEQNHITLDTHLAHGGTVPLDASRITRVVLNLCRNAIEAMGSDGGTLRVATAEGDGGGARIEIADTGPGIPPEIADTLFEPFVTHGKDHGTGLGLAIVKKVIEDYGGTIGVATAQGEGTIFTICLPAATGGSDSECSEPGDGAAATDPAATAQRYAAAV